MNQNYISKYSFFHKLHAKLLEIVVLSKKAIYETKKCSDWPEKY